MAKPTAKRRSDRGAPRQRAEHLGPERRRPLVLDAALRLFVERGYRATSMDAIAAAAGVTKPVVYACYPGKQELFRALLDREEERLLEQIGTALPSELDLGNIEALMERGFVAFLSAAVTAPDSWRVVFEAEHAAEPAIARRVARARETIVGQLVLLVEPFLESAGVEDAKRKAPVLAELLASMGEAGGRIMLAPPGEWTPEELGSLLARVALKGPAVA